MQFIFNIYIYIYIYIICIVNTFNLLFFKNHNKSNLLLDNKNVKWGTYHYEINAFLKYTLDTIIGTPKNYYE